MKNYHLAKKVVDFESGLEEVKIPTLYRHFSNSLEVGRSARLLETIRGHGELLKTTLYDFASQFSYNPEYVDKVPAGNIFNGLMGNQWFHKNGDGIPINNRFMHSRGWAGRQGSRGVSRCRRLCLARREEDHQC